MVSAMRISLSSIVNYSIKYHSLEEKTHYFISDLNSESLIQKIDLQY